MPPTAPPTAKRLYVLRHAKSSWDEPGLADHDRPLAPRGLRASGLLSEHLRREGIRPALILCSSARRARETLERAVPAEARAAAEILIEPELYEANASELVERLRRVPPGTASVMLIGHNPSLQTLVATLARPRKEEKFPTGALATLTLTGAWSALEPAGAELTGLVRPRELG
jgi:phosphohistidine phosphatase